MNLFITIVLINIVLFTLLFLYCVRKISTITIEDIYKDYAKKFLWYWKLFWGKRYTIYDKENNKKRRYLVYRKRIYELD